MADSLNENSLGLFSRSRDITSKAKDITLSPKLSSFCIKHILNHATTILKAKDKIRSRDINKKSTNTLIKAMI